jgi:dTMP kinase
MLVTLEGIDGTGKGTQARLLMQLAEAARISVDLFSFPQYGRTPFAQAISEYLNGEYGSLENVHPRLAALLFAGDRSLAQQDLAEALSSDHLVLCDRYVESNIAHQAARVPLNQRKGFERWLTEVEYQQFHMPVPDLIVLLDLPILIARRFVLQKAKRVYTMSSTDLHEANVGYLAEVSAYYEEMASADPNGSTKWFLPRCIEPSGSPASPDDIAQQIWARILHDIQQKSGSSQSH